MIHEVTPTLMVENVNQSMRFYLDILGLNMQGGLLESLETSSDSDEDRAMVFVMLGAENFKIMLQRRDSLEEDIPSLQGRAISSSIALYFEVSDVDKLHDKIKQQVKILSQPKTKFYGMREFTITDNEGYLLTLAERVEKK